MRHFDRVFTPKMSFVLTVRELRMGWAGGAAGHKFCFPSRRVPVLGVLILELDRKTLVLHRMSRGRNRIISGGAEWWS